MRPLAGKTLAMIFEQPSTRTRVSFEVAMRQLGGDVIMLTAEEMQLGRGETIADTARVLSRYVDAIMIRMLDHEQLSPNLRAHCHRAGDQWPDAALASLPGAWPTCMTFEEHRGPIRGRTVAWTGDANNVLTSWMHAAERFEFQLRVATPPELAPKKPADRLDQILAAPRSSSAPIRRRRSRAPIASSPTPGCRWATATARAATICSSRYQVNARLMARAKPDAIFMHCLPAHRGEEVTDEVIDGPQSVVFDEAENRLHAQKGILAWCLADGDKRRLRWCGTGLTIRRRRPISVGNEQIPDVDIPVRAPAPTSRRRHASCRSRSRRSICAAALCGSGRRSTPS